MLTACTRGSAATSRQSRVGGGEAELRGGLLGPAGHLVGDGDQLGRQRQLREVVQHPGVGLGVHPAHPAEPGDGDAQP